MSGREGVILWLRRDLRLSDHPALCAACAGGGPVIPVFILDPKERGLGGAAPRWRLSRSLAALSRDLEQAGSRLILRQGEALATLEDLLAETGARKVVWSRLYDPESIERDTRVKAALRTADIEAESFGGHLLYEPFAPKTKTGGFFKVYSPFWRAVSALDPVPESLPRPGRVPAPSDWPRSLRLEDLGLERAMNRGAAIVARHARIGEAAAQETLDAFVDGPIACYADRRDRPDLPGTSGLSAHLAVGEISPRTIWRAAEAAAAVDPKAEKGAEVFRKEIVWREFAWHLLYHTPHIAERNWRPEWDGFPWREDNEDAERWRRGRTGEPFVDAAMRELYVTGVMHNRARMLTASYLTKHLMTDWRVGEAWFRDCLVDWDPASNAMGWQWTAGSGPDAAPYFRIYNPQTQAEKFDPAGDYVARWLPEVSRRDLAREPHPDGLSFFEACPRRWGLSPDDAYPAPVVSLTAGRARALDAYTVLKNTEDSKELTS